MHLKDYLSYSQMILIESNPEEYARQYFEGKKRGMNRGMGLGRDLADALEKDEETGKAEMDIVIAQLPKYELRDQKIFTRLLVGKGKERKHIPILIKPDSCKADYTAFYEYKTHNKKTPWTHSRVEFDPQMTFYFTGLFLKLREQGKIMIPQGELIAAETEKRIDEDGIERPHLTGEIKRFPTTRTYGQILFMQGRMARAWTAIEKLMEKTLI